MNVLTDPLFLVQTPDGARHRQSYETILLGEADGLALTAPDAIQDLAQIWLGSNLNEALFGGVEPRSPEEVRSGIEKYAPYFELLGDGPRFLQHRVPEEHAVRQERESFAQVLTVGTPGKTSSSAYMPRERGEAVAFCLPCSAILLFIFHQMACGSGKGSSGIYSHGALTYLGGKDARTTLWANTMPSNPTTEVWGWSPLRQRGWEHEFPWLDPEYLDLLAEGCKEARVPQKFQNLRYTRFWMPRAIWLHTGETEALCAGCGDRITSLGVVGLTEGRDRSRDERGDRWPRQFGALKWPLGLIPSPFSPHTVTGKTKSKCSSRIPGVSNLLSVLPEFLGSSDEGGARAAPVINEKEQCVRSVRVLGMSAQTNFDDYYAVEIPLYDESYETIALRAEDMKADSKQVREALRMSLFFLTTKEPESGGKRLQSSSAKAWCRSLIQAWQLAAESSFPNYLAPTVAEDLSWTETTREQWRKHLISTARDCFHRAAERFSRKPDRYDSIGTGTARIQCVFKK